MSEWTYTGQPTSYEEYCRRNPPMKPSRYFVHDQATGRTLRDPSKERGGDPDAQPYVVDDITEEL